jgi:hypothetical protein
VSSKCTINISSIKKDGIKKMKEVLQQEEFDEVVRPKHYTSHPSGIETVQITEHMNFCLGNAIKYIMRSELKGNQIQDLKKAAWYINREISRIEGIRDV